jgi:hypothetical protein
MAKYVQAEADMDDETFCKHMNARHLPVAGITKLDPDAPGVQVTLKSWRGWHRAAHYYADVKMHNYQAMTHNHREGKK